MRAVPECTAPPFKLRFPLEENDDIILNLGLLPSSSLLLSSLELSDTKVYAPQIRCVSFKSVAEFVPVAGGVGQATHGCPGDACNALGPEKLIFLKNT